MVFQSYALWPHMTVEQNVAFGLDVRRIARAEQARRMQEALDAVRMGHLSKRKPNQLSGGQQQRVALARALVIRPDILLLDEPLSNLDAKLRIELRSEIRRVCKDAGITGVYVTHDQKEALSMADRIAIMSRGQVVQVGSPEELYRRPRTAFVAEFLGETNFLSGTGTDGAVETSAGRIRTAAPIDGRRPVMVAVRPEAIRIGPANREGLVGRVSGCIYLGEVVQYTVELTGGAKVRVSTMNPKASLELGTPVTLDIDPEDVVLLDE
jgi:ABC-type Fe3+/spermidine/putrescine transport system ATPase subunit